VLKDVAALIGIDRLNAQGELVLRAGKKRYCLVKLGIRKEEVGIDSK
jgi:hypothetical protein